MRAARTALLISVAFTANAAAADSGPAAAAFREANAAVRTGDYPKAIAGYRDLAGRGVESASLYWNWAQAARARGENGVALWALLRGREVEPGDSATLREVERLREAANLDAAEIAPSPLASLRRAARRWHLDLAAVALLAVSLILHALARRSRGGGLRTATAAALVLGLLCAATPLAGALAAPTAVVLRRGAPLLDSASPTAASTSALREGEVVVVLAESGDYLRVEDSSGARGWASATDAWRLDRPPVAAAP
jgi:Bacterial SH3 domain